MKFILAAILLVAAGCSTFPRDFHRAIATGRPAGSIEGPWEGSWSSAGGHSGALRCLLTASTTPDQYSARFEAKFAGVFTVHYTASVTGSKRNDATHLSGEHDLGKAAGGVYHYDATVTPAHFEATYRATSDRGEFHLSRP